MEMSLLQAVRIMELALERYGSYERFEQVTGGSLLSKTQIYHNVKKYMEKEGCVGEVRGWELVPSSNTALYVSHVTHQSHLEAQRRLGKRCQVKLTSGASGESRFSSFMSQ